jgi:catechol 2,3-dioxygenase-like lactoylglutathione lyase family enzyme
MPKVTRVSGITLRVSSMARSLNFYGDVLGLEVLYGDARASFSSLDVHGTYLNLELSPGADTGWGRIILYCDDVDEMHRRLRSKGYRAVAPRDAPWGEKYFHIKDPDGHELSLAQPLAQKSN